MRYPWTAVPLLVLILSCSQKNNHLITIKETEISISKIDSFISSKIDSTKLVGVSVSIVNGNKIVYSGHFGKKNFESEKKVTDQTIYEVASLSKPVFTFFTLKQVEKGILDLDEPLYKYLPNPDIGYDDRYKQITARMVLCHSTGFPNWRKKNDSLRIKFNPGSAYGYSGEGYEYLKNVLVKMLETDDKGLDSIFQKEITEPLGIANFSFTWRSAYLENKAHGHYNNRPTDNSYHKSKSFFKEKGPHLFASSYSLYSTSNAYAKFIIALLQKRILGPDTFDELFRPQTEMPIFPDTKTHRSLISFIKKTPDGLRYFHTGDNGDFQAWTHFYPNSGFGIVILTNGDNLFSSGFAEDLLILLDESVGKN
ncbi:serine hydrolase domain-containing protein [uncultured Croceitalea sp.]|uniref:serine hydrolase domain-containing protein n=1 Tax=uncultured Croceitalea sp. TaxID=1798908 RepID=UPI0033061BBE